MFKKLVEEMNPGLPIMGAGARVIVEDELTVQKFIKKGSDVVVILYDRLNDFKVIDRIEMEVRDGKLIYK